MSNLPTRRPSTSNLPGPVAGSGTSEQPATVDKASLARSLRGPLLLGVATVTIFLGGFGLWGSLVPIAGGAVAPGIISPDGSRRTVQHLEGGIVGDILVKDGQKVEAGQPLLVLEETQARASYQMLLGQQRSLQATFARLSAEQLQEPVVTFPEDLLVAAEQDAEVRKIVDSQARLFATRNEMHESRKRVLRQRVEQLNEQIRGLDAQLKSATQRLSIVNEELVAKRALLKKELVPKPEVLRLEREEAQVVGDRGEYLASIARAKQQIGETELQLVAADAERADQIAGELDKTRASLAEVDEKIYASEDILKRTVINSPVAGTIVNLAFKTKGGVVKPGDPILEVVPAEEDLLIDARISPTDIDIVHAGLGAQVRLSAFASRRMPRVDGIVRSVSADRLSDKATGEGYYLARVEVDREKLKRDVGPDIELVPGMPAEVLIVTGERTMIEYLIKPMEDAFLRSMRES